MLCNHCRQLIEDTHHFCTYCGQFQQLASHAGTEPVAEYIDLTPVVSDIRRFRACAVIPVLLGVTLIAMSPLALFAGSRDWPTFRLMLISGTALLILGKFVASGSVWAMSILALAGWFIMFAVLWGLAFDASMRESPGSILSTLAFSVALCWLTTLGLRASIRHLRFSRTLTKIPRNVKALPFPKDKRLWEAAKPFAMSLLVYIAAIPFAVIVAAAVPVHGLIARFVYSPFAGIASRLYRQARQISSLRVTEIRKLDTRQPLLFIRSFSDDNLRLERKFDFARFFAPNTLTLEEFIVNRSWALGPVIAIGKPGEELSPLGAAREYLAVESWRDRFRDLLHDSQLLVSVLGITPGLLWEYGNIAACGAVGKLLVVFPPLPLPSAYKRWEIFRAAFPQKYHLPACGKNLPLVATFAGDGRPLLFICRHQNETAYNVAFDVAFSQLQFQFHPGKDATSRLKN